MKQKNWYVYKLTFSDSSFYVGYRGTTMLVEHDFLVKYFSSSKVVKAKILNGESYYGEIISKFDCKEAAYYFEQQTINDNFSNSAILNKACYFGRTGFGILSDTAKQRISETTSARWKDPTYRETTIQSQKQAWTDKRKLAQSSRLAGVKRPAHSVLMKTKSLSENFKCIEKTESHKLNISAALLGKPKSEAHKAAMRKPKGPAKKHNCPFCERMFDAGNLVKHIRLSHASRDTNSK
jgi:hypothetical protein